MAAETGFQIKTQNAARTLSSGDFIAIGWDPSDIVQLVRFSCSDNTLSIVANFGHE